MPGGGELRITKTMLREDSGIERFEIGRGGRGGGS